MRLLLWTGGRCVGGAVELLPTEGLVIYRVLIQHALSTGRFHPAWYRESPLPGGVTHPRRFKSGGHHTEGYATAEEAQAGARSLASRLPFWVRVPEDGFPIRQLREPGADILIEPGSGRVSF